MNKNMKQITYTKTETSEIKGYVFDGTIECAKNIWKEVYVLDSEWADPFNLSINLSDDSIEFSWKNRKISQGDFIAVKGTNNGLWMHDVVDIINAKDLNMWGFKLK